MPGPDGFTVAGQMRADGDVPILVVSGESAEEAKVRALGIGADDYLVKPFGKRGAAGPDRGGDAPRGPAGRGAGRQARPAGVADRRAR